MLHEELFRELIHLMLTGRRICQAETGGMKFVPCCNQSLSPGTPRVWYPGPAFVISVCRRICRGSVTAFL